VGCVGLEKGRSREKQKEWNKDRKKNSKVLRVPRTKEAYGLLAGGGEEVFGIVSIIAVDIQLHCWWAWGTTGDHIKGQLPKRCRKRTPGIQ